MMRQILLLVLVFGSVLCNAQPTKRIPFTAEKLENRLLEIDAELTRNYGNELLRKKLLSEWKMLLSDPAAFQADFHRLAKEVHITWSKDSAIRFFARKAAPFVSGNSFQIYYLCQSENAEKVLPGELVLPNGGWVLEASPVKLRGKLAYLFQSRNLFSPKFGNECAQVYFFENQRLAPCKDCIEPDEICTTFGWYAHPRFQLESTSYPIQGQDYARQPLIYFNGADSLIIPVGLKKQSDLFMPLPNRVFIKNDDAFYEKLNPQK